MIGYSQISYKRKMCGEQSNSKETKQKMLHKQERTYMKIVDDRGIDKE